jgi:flagellar motor switch protein FliN
MTVADASHRDALLRLGAATSEAVGRVLETFAPGAVERGDVTVYGDGEAPMGSIVRGSVTASVSYIDGVTGANIFVLPGAGARGLAAAMGAPAPDEDESGEPPALTELEISAVSEASNQMMAAGAAAISVVLGQQIGISPPDTRVIDDPIAARESFGPAPHATSTTFMIGGESCRLIQLVPTAFVVRMARALDEMGIDLPGREGTGLHDADTVGANGALVDALGDITLRVWAELGRADLPLGDALGLPLGAVLELDRAADDPIDLFINGMRFARGHLIVTDDREWALALDEVSGHPSAGDAATAGPAPAGSQPPTFTPPTVTPDSPTEDPDPPTDTQSEGAVA